MQDQPRQRTQWRGNDKLEDHIRHHQEPGITAAPEDTLGQHGIGRPEYHDDADGVH